MDPGIQVVSELKEHTQLRVFFGPSHIQNQFLCNLHGQNGPIHFFQHIQRQINPGGNPRAGIDILIFDKQPILQPAGLWESLLKLFQVFPMGVTAFPFQNPGKRQDKGPGTDRTNLGFSVMLLL